MSQKNCLNIVSSILIYYFKRDFESESFFKNGLNSGFNELTISYEIFVCETWSIRKSSLILLSYKKGHRNADARDFWSLIPSFNATYNLDISGYSYLNLFIYWKCVLCQDFEKNLLKAILFFLYLYSFGNVIFIIKCNLESR